MVNEKNYFSVGAPQFQSKFLVLSARRGEKLTIECTPKGDRPMRFSWRRNDQIIDPATEARQVSYYKFILLDFQQNGNFYP